MAPSSIRRLALAIVIVVYVNHRSAKSLVVVTPCCEGGRLRLRRRIPIKTPSTLFNNNCDLVDEEGCHIRNDVNINNNIGPYIRIQKRGRHYDVQTAITTFRSGRSANDTTTTTTTTTVDLHAQIHFADESYYNYFNDEAFGSRYDKVLYELIVDERFLEQASPSTIPGFRRLSSSSSTTGGVNPIAPTPIDQNTALQYGLQCQVDGIRYCQDDWIHADLTREEFLSQLNCDKDYNRGEIIQEGLPGQQKQPLWALASTSATYPGYELVSSLLRPLTTRDGGSSSSAALTRRLFTHLFLPGDALSGWIRAILWLGVPSPELSIVLVDWSSLSYVGHQQRSRRRRRLYDDIDNIDNDTTYGIAPISPIAAPVLLSLLLGKWGTARRLVFGQVLVAGQSSSNADGSRNGVLIDKRNERAMDVLRQSLSSLSYSSSERGKKRRNVALLYGAGHCRDLHQRLVQVDGMIPIRTEWRTAFRATAPQWGKDLVATVNQDGIVVTNDWTVGVSTNEQTALECMDKKVVKSNSSISTLESVAVGLVILPLYMLIGGFDWVSTIRDAEYSFRGGLYVDGIVLILLYVLRHAAMYVGLSKFVVDLGGTGVGNFVDDEST